MSSIILVVIPIVTKTLVPSLFKIFSVKITMIQCCFVFKKKPKNVMTKTYSNSKISTGPLLSDLSSSTVNVPTLSSITSLQGVGAW